MYIDTPNITLDRIARRIVMKSDNFWTRKDGMVAYYYNKRSYSYRYGRFGTELPLNAL
jgi:hypothetical protein